MTKENTPEIEITPIDLHELYAREPEKISDDEFEALVQKLRADRSKFIMKEGTGKAKPKTSTPKKAASPARTALQKAVENVDTGGIEL